MVVGGPVMCSNCGGQSAGPCSYCRLGMPATSRGSKRLRLSAWRNPKNLGRLGLGRFLNACMHSRRLSLTEYLLSTRSGQESLGVTLSCVVCLLPLRILPIGMVRPHGNPLKYWRYPHFTVQSAEAPRGEISCKRSDGY